MTEHNHNNERPPVPNLTISKAIIPFFFPLARGRLVRLGPLTDALLQRHNYPPIISKLGGEALTLVAALASALKFEGSFSLQVKGEGAVSMVVADCTHTGGLRFYARFDEEQLKKLPEKATAHQLFGKGLFALTVDQLNDKDTYQGMVEISGDSLSEMAIEYFNSSEQLPCWIRLTCKQTPEGWQAAGLILEKIASDQSIIFKSETQSDEETKEDDWNTLTILAETLTTKELLDENLNPEHLLYRLFNSAPISIGKAKPVSYGCRCSRSRLANLLQTFSKEDLDSMNEAGAITMTCEFCHYNFTFPRGEIST